MNLRWIIDSHAKARILKYLEENTIDIFVTLRQAKISQGTKSINYERKKFHKKTLSKVIILNKDTTKNNEQVKQTSKKYSQSIYLTKDSHTEQIKIFYKLTMKRQLNNNGQKSLNKHFTKDKRMTKKNIKRSSILLVIRKCNIKS